MDSEKGSKCSSDQKKLERQRIKWREAHDAAMEWAGPGRRRKDQISKRVGGGGEKTRPCTTSVEKRSQKRGRR